MKLKLKGLAALCVVAAAPAFAQSSNVTVYGIIDTGVEYLNHANAAGDSLVRMPNLTGTVPSRFGIRGSEDLGGGLRAVFALENGFNPDAGSLGQGGRLFGRQAWVGLAGPWGTVSMGRTYSMLFYSMLSADVMGPAIYAAGSMDGYLPNSRHDNSVSYMGKFSAVTVGATYSLGRDVASAGGPAATNCAGEQASDKSACRQWTALVKYDSPLWGAALAYDEMKGGTGAAGGLNSSSKSDQRISANGYVMVNKIKVGGGLLYRDNDGVTTPRSNLWYLGVSVPFASSFVFDGQVLRYDLKDSGNDANMIAVRVLDNLSRRTAVYVTAGYIDNRGNSAISVSGGGTVGMGMSQTGVMTGVRHAF